MVQTPRPPTRPHATTENERPTKPMSMIFNTGDNGTPPGGPMGPGGGDDLIKDGTVQTFGPDVIEASMQVPVLVDFWAPWCGPCKQLTPLLEKLVRGAGGRVKLVKINIDENPEFSQHLQIQSVPTVYAFKNGQPVDGFAGALPESQLKAFLDKLVGGLGPSPLEQALDEGEARLEAGDLTAAAQLFSSVLQQAADEPRAIGGLARCYLLNQDADRARQILDAAPPALQSHPAVASVRAELDLAAGAADSGELAALKAAAEADPKNHQARYDYAAGLAAAGKRGEAIDELLEIVRADRNWNDEAARKQLLTLFEALGPTHELAIGGRRRLSALLFA